MSQPQVIKCLQAQFEKAARSQETENRARLGVRIRRNIIESTYVVEKLT